VSDYWNEREARFVRAIDRLAESAPDLLEHARRNAAPAVLIRCRPHGHEMTRIVLTYDADHKRYRIALATLEELTQPVRVAARAEPGRMRGVCIVPGCPHLTSAGRGELYCEDHRAAGYDADEIADTRTSLSCAFCSYNEPKLSVSLLERYVAAYLRGTTQIRLR